MKKILAFISVFVLLFVLLHQCDRAKQTEKELLRLKNNNTALKDTIKYHTDKNGYLIGEIRGLELKLEEIDKEFDQRTSYYS